MFGTLGITYKMENKYIVGIFLGTLVLLGGLYNVQIFGDKIEVEISSDVCSKALLRVTKDDFTIKCGSRIAFKADTIIEYYKTYGTDEWVRNNRYVGRNKKDITLQLIEHEDSFEILRSTKYRKGRQYVLDGLLTEKYTFTKDKVKIDYYYVVDNKAKHRISMRIDKQYKSFLDPTDPNYTGILVGDVLYYEGFGDLFIDPTITLVSPANNSVAANESDTISLTCNSTNDVAQNVTNMTFYWSANGTWVANGTTSFSTPVPNASITLARVIPHQTSAGTFLWNCQSCTINSSGSNANCSFAGNNRTVNPIYRPNAVNLTGPGDSNLVDLNLLNGTTDWNQGVIYSSFTNLSNNDTLYINWTHPSHPDDDNITFNLSYFGTTNSTRRYDKFRYTTTNGTIAGDWNFTGLGVDDYFITIIACTEDRTTLCVNDTYALPIEIFDYTPSISTGESKIRYPTQPTLTKGAALGQTSSQGIIKIDWLGSGFPTGEVNLTLNISDTDGCTTFFEHTSNNVSAMQALTNHSRNTIFNDATADPQYIWLWVTKASCGTTTISNTYNLEVLE